MLSVLVFAIMKSKGPLLLLLFTHSAAVFAQSSGDYGRFQVILDKQLLGRAAADASPADVTTPVTPPPVWASEYRMTMMTRDAFDGSICVGLQHARDNSGYLLMQGAPSTQGFQLTDADFDANRATIRFNGAPHIFHLEAGTEVSPQPAAPPGGRNISRSTRIPPRQPDPPALPPGPPPEQPEAVRFNTPEELQIHLQNVQMDALRTGKPPLPIPLTPEMDQQLVREGVLPPQESE